MSKSNIIPIVISNPDGGLDIRRTIENAKICEANDCDITLIFPHHIMLYPDFPKATKVFLHKDEQRVVHLGINPSDLLVFIKKYIPGAQQ